jgi:hypothetical protein
MWTSQQAVHDAISLGLDFSPGRSGFHTVHPTSETGHFTMVKSTFKLTEDSAPMALEAAIGGYCDNLHVSCIKVSFTVSCKHVGFWILKCHFVLLPAIEMLIGRRNVINNGLLLAHLNAELSECNESAYSYVYCQKG